MRPEAKAALEKLVERTGQKEAECLSRMINWVAEQDLITQNYVLGLAIEPEGWRAAMDELAAELRAWLAKRRKAQGD